MAVENERVVEIERRIEAPREEVFVYLTDPDKYTRWMGMAAELDPRPGGVYRVRMNSDTVALGEYVAVEPPSRVVFTWGWEGDTAVPPGSTTVEITLRDDGEGTILRLRHSGFTTDEAAATHRAGWAMYVERLSVATPGGDPGPRPHRTRSGRIGSEDLDDVPDELGTPHDGDCNEPDPSDPRDGRRCPYGRDLRRGAAQQHRSKDQSQHGQADHTEEAKREQQDESRDPGLRTPERRVVCEEPFGEQAYGHAVRGGEGDEHRHGQAERLEEREVDPAGTDDRRSSHDAGQPAGQPWPGSTGKPAANDEIDQPAEDPQDGRDDDEE